MPGDRTIVSRLPECDFHGSRDHVQAHYDGRTVNGPWAFMCEFHFQKNGVGLGVGKGQLLVLEQAKS